MNPSPTARALAELVAAHDALSAAALPEDRAGCLLGTREQVDSHNMATMRFNLAWIAARAALSADEGAPSEGAGEVRDDDELLVGNLIAATLAEERAHEGDDSDREKDYAASRFIRAKDSLLRRLSTLRHVGGNSARLHTNFIEWAKWRGVDPHTPEYGAYAEVWEAALASPLPQVREQAAQPAQLPPDELPGPRPGYPTTSRDWLAAIVDIWEDDKKHAPGEGCYVPGALGDAIEKAAQHLDPMDDDAFAQPPSEPMRAAQQPPAAAVPAGLYDAMAPSAADWLSTSNGAVSRDWRDGWDACRNWVALRVREQAESKGAEPDSELPGMWERADFEGGETDAAPPAPTTKGKT